MNTLFVISYVVLWVLVVVLAGAVFALYHHFGQMYMTSPEGRVAHGPEEGSLFPALDTKDLDGEVVTLPAQDRPFIAVFASTGCTLCGALRSVLRKFAAEHPDVLVVVICDGHPRAVREWAGDLASAVRVIPDPRGRIAARYEIGLTPFSVAVSHDGRVRSRGIVNGLDGLELAAHEAANQLTVLSAPTEERSTSR
ncbi:redoxin family protein [Microtetraspora malaysiensis]|uniref:redoxin family protein n=1 Tax=Microtetraspora malaysiensis TaxID=161358 RepID=UPI003D8A658D